MLRKNSYFSLLLVASLLVGAGCAGDTGDYVEGDSAPVDDPVLVPESVVKDGWPGNEALPREDKADQNFPKKFSELKRLQSPVKSQGSRGVCSIFSTAAYMEHLYIAEGTITDPDFSEQYLQWSAKFEVGRFKHTSGSNAGANLDAISDFGIPEEDAWPYESSPWGSSDDPDCDGEDEMPTKCYTNGEPPEEALDAEKFFLPDGRWISTRTRSIKSHIFNKKQGVVVGLTFFYQSWNHRRSDLETNREYWKEGYVLSPNAKDEELSLENRAGHSILLIGWDDELEVPKRDAEGNVIEDENGDPVMEKGFFIFKNSWGTGSFGASNPHGDGYGFISYDYVEEWGSGRISDLPELDVADEVCGDGIDNDDNGFSDCNDDACSEDPLCTETSQIIELEFTDGAIPDNDPEGLTVPFEITEEGTVEGMKLTVDITHTYRGDLSVALVHPDGTEAELKRNGHDSGDDLQKTFAVDQFDGKSAAGEYLLRIADHASIDTGELNSASVEFVRN